MKSTPEIHADARGLRAIIVASAYHAEVTSALVRGARDAFLAARGAEGSLEVVHAPGAFEVPMLVDRALATGAFDFAVGVGCIVRGETVHDRHLGQAVTQELLSIAVRRGRPVGLAVLTVEDIAQAHARAGGALGNKGAEAMAAAIATCNASAAMGPHGQEASR
jgi:6,7-dimethyl-8-ribityllumazine synthase